jgi:hypothetical protein
VHVVLDTTDHVGRAVPLLEDPRLIGEQGISHFIGQPQVAVLGALYEMDQILN